MSYPDEPRILSPSGRGVVKETEHGLQLSPYDPEFEKAMAIYREGSQKFRQALKKLAQ